MKKFCVVSLFFMLFLIIGFNEVESISADSGWDSSYDSGSSSSDWGSSSSDWDSSYDSGSSSSWSSSSSSGSSSFTGIPIFVAIFMEVFCSIHYFVFAFRPLGKIFGSDEKKAMKISLTLFAIRVVILIIADIINPMYCIFDFIFLFILAFIVVPACSIFGKKTNSSAISIKPKTYYDVSDSVLLKYGITDVSVFKHELFDIYVDIQKAWMNFDYHTLGLLLTDELYNMYVSQLEALKLKNEKNVMSDFENIDLKIYSVTSNNGIVTLKFYLNVKMYDYVVDYYNNVTRGNKNKKMNITYLITMQKNVGDVVTECPNCGAKIENNQTTCRYCDSKFANNSTNWVMSKKECIEQI